MPIAPGQTLLEAAEAGGVAGRVAVPRRNLRHVPRTRVTEGEVECVSDALSADEQASGFVLACVATARSGCTLDI